MNTQPQTITIADVLTGLSQVIDRVNDERNASTADKDVLIGALDDMQAKIDEARNELIGQITATVGALAVVVSNLRLGVEGAFVNRNETLQNIITSPGSPETAVLVRQDDH